MSDAPVCVFGAGAVGCYLGGRLDEVFESLRAIGRRGDLHAREFRDLADAALPKVHASAHREFVDGAELAGRLENEFGWTVLEHDCKTGRSPYRSEDPALYRILARRAPSAR